MLLIRGGFGFTLLVGWVSQIGNQRDRFGSGRESTPAVMEHKYTFSVRTLLITCDQVLRVGRVSFTVYTPFRSLCLPSCIRAGPTDERRNAGM